MVVRIIVDVFGMGCEGGFRMAVIPLVLIAIWVNDHKAMLIRQLVEFVASPLTHRLSIHQREDLDLPPGSEKGTRASCWTFSIFYSASTVSLLLDHLSLDRL